MCSPAGRYGCKLMAAGNHLVRGDEICGGSGIPVEPTRFPPCGATRTQPVQKGRSAITTTTNEEPAQQVPTALFSHPTTQHANGKAVRSTGQPLYENLFQEPSIPTHRETVD